MDAELLYQRLFCYQNHLVIDAYLSGCMYNSIRILKVFLLSLFSFVVAHYAAWRFGFALGGLLSNRLYQLHRSFFPFCQLLFHSHNPHRRRRRGRARSGHFYDVVDQAFHCETRPIVGFGKSSVVTVELGRCFASNSITLLLTAAPNRHPLPWNIPVCLDSEVYSQIQAEISYKDLVSGESVTRHQTFCIQGTDNRVDFLSRIDGYSTAVLIAKDVCSNVRLVITLLCSWTLQRQLPTM